MLNYIWLTLLIASVLLAGFGGNFKAVTDGAVKGAETAVTLALGLVGVMALWLGLMRLAEKSGLVQKLALVLRPVLKRLFPDVPADHPAMGSMVMNMAANMLGLNNAATPLGLRAMKDLESLNPHPGVATNAMCTFLAINTSSVQLIPITAIAILASAGSKNPSAIIGTALLSTLCAATAGVAAVKLLEKTPLAALPPSAKQPAAAAPASTATPEVPPPTALPPFTTWRKLVIALFAGCFLYFVLGQAFPALLGRETTVLEIGQNPLVRLVNSVSLLAIPFLLSFFPLWAALRGVKVYEEFVEGAKEGFQVALRIIPFLVAMLVAVGMFRGSGGLDILGKFLKPVLDLLHFPTELAPMALLRPLSGSGTLALFSEIVKHYGPDSLLARMAGTLYGSTETTFYVLAVYFGSVSVHRTRHALAAGLIADAVGAAASIFVCRMVFQ